MSKRVTIITACFNNQHTISDTIKSVLNQTYNNIQYVIIDGGSTDGTSEIILSYKPLFDQKNFVFISEEDYGISDAWNKGLNLADGDIIGILNADDYYDLNSVEKAANAIDPDELTITYGVCKFIDSTKYVVKTNALTFDENNIVRGFQFMHTTCFASKKVYNVVGTFNVELKLAMDSEFLIRCFLNKVKFVKIDNITYMRVGGISDSQRIKSYKIYLGELKKYDFRISVIPYYKLFVKQKIKRILKVNFIKRFLIQLLHLTIFSINLIYNLLPLFFLRKIFLRVIRIKIGKKSFIHPWVTFFHFGHLTVGDNSVINRSCYIDNRRKIQIGNNVSIGHNTKIYTLGHDINDPYFRNKGKEVLIDDYVCIFTNVLIMPGVHIKKGAVIYAGAVVTKDVDEFNIVGGNPAKVLGIRNNDLRYNLNHGYWKAL